MYIYQLCQLVSMLLAQESCWTLPSGHIPNPHISVAAAADKYVVPRDHGPDPHYMTLQRPLVISLGVEDMYFGVVQGNHNIFLRQM